MLKSKLKGHHRIDPPRSHDLVAYARLCQALDALYCREHVRQLELEAFAAVQTATVEKADHVKIHKVHSVDPIVDLGLVPRDAHRDATRLPVPHVLADGLFIPRRVELVHVSAVQVRRLAADLDHTVNGRRHI